jgi:hypothetical protein
VQACSLNSALSARAPGRCGNSSHQGEVAIEIEVVGTSAPAFCLACILQGMAAGPQAKATHSTTQSLWWLAQLWDACIPPVHHSQHACCSQLVGGHKGKPTEAAGVRVDLAVATVEPAALQACSECQHGTTQSSGGAGSAGLWRSRRTEQKRDPQMVVFRNTGVCAMTVLLKRALRECGGPAGCPWA